MESLATRLKAARERAGYDKATDAAEALGIKYPTYAGHENGTRVPDIDTVIRYSKRFKVKLEWLLTGIGELPPKKEALPVNFIPVIGKVAAGALQTIETVEGDGTFEMIAASTDYPLEWQYAYEIEGGSLNKIAPDGSRVVCLDIASSGYSVRDGDLVIVEKSLYGGQAIERTAKRIRKTSQGFDLWPESHDEEHQAPIPINGKLDGEEYTVKAKVIWILTKP